MDMGNWHEHDGRDLADRCAVRDGKRSRDVRRAVEQLAQRVSEASAIRVIGPYAPVASIPLSSWNRATASLVIRP